MNRQIFDNLPGFQRKLIIYFQCLAVLFALTSCNKPNHLLNSATTAQLNNPVESSITESGETVSGYDIHSSKANNTSDITITSESLSIKDSSTGNFIKLGMPKKDVDTILGVQNQKDFKGLYNYNGLQLFYRDDLVAGMVIENLAQTSQFKILGDMSDGSTIEDVKKILGDPTQKVGSQVTYVIKKDGNVYQKQKQIDFSSKALQDNNLYIIAISTAKDSIYSIIVGDYQYSINLS